MDTITQIYFINLMPYVDISELLIFTLLLIYYCKITYKNYQIKEEKYICISYINGETVDS